MSNRAVVTWASVDTVDVVGEGILIAGLATVTADDGARVATGALVSAQATITGAGDVTGAVGEDFGYGFLPCFGM